MEVPQYFPDIIEVCKMICSSDVIYKGKRFSCIEPRGNDHLHFVGHDPEDSFYIEKHLVNINDFSTLEDL